MKILRSIIALALLLALLVGMVALCPTKETFAAYYVRQNSTGYGALFDKALEMTVRSRVTEQNYLFFSVFELEGERYIGILDHFISRSTAKQAMNTLEKLVQQARSAVDDEATPSA